MKTIQKIERKGYKVQANPSIAGGILITRINKETGREIGSTIRYDNATQAYNAVKTSR